MNSPIFRHLQKELLLPCGIKIQNRIAKSAMSENMSPKHHGPTRELIKAYQQWVNGGAGLIITGNIMIDGKAIAEPGNVLVENKNDFELLKEWASIVKGTGLHLWPQINHPGRQAMGFLNKEVVAPSAIKTKLRGMDAMFKKPRALLEEEILEIINRFGNTALILKEAGFTGIQIHAAHGYLISQFLSPLTNLRKDKWGGSLENRMNFVVAVYRSIREKVGLNFPIGIKINSADFQRGGFSESESEEVIKTLDAEGIDLIEISGGNYEQPSMTGIGQKKSTIEREAYFLDYVERVKKIIKTPLMLTGGFRTASFMDEAIAQEKVDLIGLARPFALYPNLPKELFAAKRISTPISTPKTGIEILDKSGFIEIKWYEMQIHRLGKGKEPDPNLSAYSVMLHNLKETMKKLILGKKK